MATAKQLPSGSWRCQVYAGTAPDGNVSTVLSLPILRRKRSMPPWSGSSTTGKYLGTLLI